MVSKKFKLPTFLFFFACFILTSQLSAEETESAPEIESTSSSELEFKQKLEWIGDNSAFEYKVEIRNLATKEILEFETEDTQIEFSLPSGEYEWRVIAFDILGRESSQAEWERFTIRKAIEPDVKTKKDEIFINPKKELTIPVKTDNIQPDAKIVLIDLENNKEIEGRIEGGNAVFEKAPEGDYKIRITNPGGRSSETEVIKVSKKEKDKKEKVEKERKEINLPDTFILLGVNYLLNLANREIFLNTPTAIGADLKVEMLPFELGIFKAGFNIETNPTPLIKKDSYIDEMMIFIPLNFNLALFYPIIEERLMVGVQAGGGGIGVLHTAKFSEMEDGFSRDNINNFYINYMYDAGVVLRVYFGKRFVADIAAQFASWRVGGYNLMNILAGAQIGLRF